MRILLSNDDGYLAPGLGCLATAVSEFADITVVAPDRNRSGASNSLTLATPLRARRAPNGFFFVDGTPTDCVHIAITGLMSEEPDMVIAICTQSVGVPSTKKNPFGARRARSGVASVNELLAPLRLRSGATTVMSANSLTAVAKHPRPGAR
jgi:hypothetical protein